MAIAGIEGLAQGFMQGMALKRQNDRQDVLDAQNLERFGMDKERFATQQAASAFDLQNAQTNAANAATDRTRNLGIQAKQDAFDVKMKRLLSTGDDNLATLAEVEKVQIEDGAKGAFQRDPKTGVILTDAKGFATWINADGSPPQKHTGDSARKLFFAKQYPKEAMTREITNADTIAAEDREAKRSDAVAKRDNKYAVDRLYTIDSINDGNEKPEKETPLSAADFKIFFGEDYEIGKDANGLPKMGNRIDRQLQNKFLAWASVNKRKATMSAYQDWVANGNQGQPQGQNTNDTYKSKSQGDLTVTGGLDKESGAVDMSGRSKLGSQGAAQPAVPKSLTIPRPVPTVSYENMPIKSVTKTAVRQGRGGGSYTYQEVLATRDMPIPPEGFKRKSLSERDPNFNVFVSNNYQD